MLGFLSDAKAINEAITGFLASSPNPTSSDELYNFLSLYSGTDRDLAAQLLVQRGVDSTAVARARSDTAFVSSFKISPLWAAIAVASSAASAYHGYKRNQSVKWGVIWGLLGGVAPVLTPAIAVAQGFGKRKAA